MPLNDKSSFDREITNSLFQKPASLFQEYTILRISLYKYFTHT